MRSSSGQPSRPSRSTTIRAALGVALLAGVFLGGCGAANAGSSAGAAADPPTAAASTPATVAGGGAVPIPIDGPGSGAPSGSSGSVSGSSGVAASNAGTAASGSAVASIAFPYPGSSGVAPDHTIVVVGTGEASVASGASDAARTTAEHDALTAALADARAQADTIAAAVHVTIDGVLSVSASRSPYVVYPMGIEAPASGATTPGALRPTVPTPVPGPTVMTASVTVAYTIH
jgi:Protein of unknown function (DUF541)